MGDSPYKHGLNIRVAPKGFDLSDVDPSSIGEAEVSADGLSQVVSIEALGLPEYAADLMKSKPFQSLEWRGDSSSDPFSTVHQRGATSLLHVGFNKSQASDRPVDISVEVVRGPIFSTILVHMGERSVGTIRLSLTGEKTGEEKTKPLKEGSSKYTSLEVRVVGEQGSALTFVLSESMPADQVVVIRQQAHLEQDARVDWLGLSLGSHYAQIDVVSDLDGVGAESEMTYLYLATGSQRKSLTTHSIHTGRSTLSNIITRGVVADSAKVLSQGLVKINPDAAGSNGYETQDALLLSPKTEADAIPNLEIHNHDVKCSHGSTVGQVDAEVLHYLRSRGVSLVESKRLIVEGYFTPLLEKIADAAIGERVRAAVTRSIK